MRSRLTVLTTAGLSIAAAFAVNLVTNAINIHDDWRPAVWTIAMVIIIGSMAAELAISHRTPSGRPAVISIEYIVNRLAQSVEAQWRREEEQRRVADPIALPTRWHVVTSDLVDHWSNIRRLPANTPNEPLPLAGCLNDIARVYKKVPSGRLVLLGKGGAGKTVLAARLALDLLESRTAHDRIPVIVSIGSWNPGTPLRAWLAEQLIRDYPALGNIAEGTTLAMLLLESDRIIPLLDGFDEINFGFRTTALEQMNAATSLPLVLTSRLTEYEAAVKASDVLSNAAAIELDALSLPDLVEYLPRTTRRRATNGNAGLWDPVLADLGKSPDRPESRVLLRVLANPLMVYLARTIYSDAPGHDPCEMFDHKRFPTADHLEQHLISAYLPAIYRPPSPNGRIWNVDNAHRWLHYLADHLERLNTRDLAWWRLRDTVPRINRVIVSAIAGGIVDGLPFAFIGRLPVGLVFGLTAGSVIGFATHGKSPERTYSLRKNVRSLMTQALNWLPGRLIGSITSGPMAGISSSDTAAAALAFFAAIAFGLSRPSRATCVPTPKQNPIGTRVKSTASAIVGGAVIGVLGMLALGPTFGVTEGLVIGLGAWIAFGLQSPLDMTTVLSVPDSLASDRMNAIRHTIAGGLVVGVVFSLVSNLGGALVCGFVIGIGGSLVCAWGQWLVIVRIWLPLSGRLPWAVTDFLSDAHNRGVFRQTGAVYQFRHARLQEYLTHTLPIRSSK